jgi:hypothetical protein
MTAATAAVETANKSATIKLHPAHLNVIVKHAYKQYVDDATTVVGSKSS